MKGFLNNKLDLVEAMSHQEDPYYGDDHDLLVYSTSELLKSFSTTGLEEFPSQNTLEDSVRRHLKRTYFENKDRIIRESIIQDPSQPRWIPTPIVEGKEEEKERQDRSLEKTLITFFEADELDKKMARMEQRLKLTNKEALTYDDIMIRMDQVLEKMPDSLRSVFEPRDIVDTVDSLAPIEYSQQDLLWKNFSGHFYKIMPKMTYEDHEGYERASFRYEETSVRARSEIFSAVATHFKDSVNDNDREMTFTE